MVLVSWCRVTRAYGARRPGCLWQAAPAGQVLLPGGTGWNGCFDLGERTVMS